MKTIITGTVDDTDIEAIGEDAEMAGIEITELVSGSTRGIDKPTKDTL